MGRTYIEDFDDGPGGWFGWEDNLRGPRPLSVRDGAAWSYSPWWIDYNHAPPGAGYLHLPFILLTKGAAAAMELYTETAGRNRFIEGRYPTDFTGVEIHLRLRGELRARGAQLVLLAQASIGGITSGWALTASPFSVCPNWTEQKIVVEPVEGRWTCLGTRHDRRDFYGVLPLSEVLRDVNADIMFILFPLRVTPMGPIRGDPHLLRAGRDYPVWQSELPEGWLELDRVQIDFP
jgi:hypothetical protein